MNKTKIKKLAALAAAIILLAGLAVFANALVGNPVSKWAVRRAAEDRLDRDYPGYKLQSVNYNFKDGSYYARAAVPGSRDKHFTLYFDGLGRYKRDSFEELVLQGWNIASRLDEAYRQQVKSVLEAPDFPYVTDICYGSLEMIQREYAHRPDVPDWAIVHEDLELDADYDLAALGAQAGRLTVYILTEEDLTAEGAAEALLAIRARMDAAGARFYAIDLVLRHPKDPETSAWPAGALRLDTFFCSDITQPGLAERISALARIEQ